MCSPLIVSPLFPFQNLEGFDYSSDFQETPSRSGSMFGRSLELLEALTLAQPGPKKSTFFRSLSYTEKSVLNNIFQYHIEMMNIIVTVTSVSVLIIRATWPAPFLLVQSAVIIVTTIWTLSHILGFAVSFLKLLFVTHFQVVFPLDQDRLGHRVLLLAMAMGVVPNSIAGVYLTLQGSPVSKFAQLTINGSAESQPVIPYNFIYSALWGFLSTIMLSIAVLYIPYRLKINQQNNAAIQAD